MSRINVRLLAIALLAVSILVALVLATGGGFSGQSSSSPTQPPAPQATPPPAIQVQGRVRIKVTQLGAHTWQFTYRIQNTGTVPVAGFEIISPRANLFHIRGRPGWTYYGSGVCGERHPGVLIYWSTGTTDRAIPPRGVAHFSFRVNTTGSARGTYSLSWDSATPLFGRILAPAGSSLPAAGSCP
jgi:hypothetical protein